MRSVEPFFEPVGPVHDVVGATAYWIGYRAQGTGHVLAAIEIPAEVVEEAVVSKGPSSVTMSPSGELIAASGAFLGADAGSDSALVPIDRLVAQVVAPENARLEEAGPDELKTLLIRLGHSVVCAKGALARYDGA